MDSREITMVVCFHHIINGMLSTFYVSSMLAEDRRTCIRRWGQFSVFVVLNAMFFCFVTPYAWPRGLVMEIANLYFTFCCFSKPLKVKLFTLFSMLAVAVFTELCAYAALFIIFDSSKFIPFDITENSMHMAAGVIISNMLCFLFFILIIALKKIVLHQMKKRELLIYIIFPIYQFFSLVLFLRTYPRLDRTMIYMGTLLFSMNFLLACFIIFSVDHLISRMQTQENLSVLMVKRQEELEYYLQVQKNLTDMRAMKHDFANQLQTLYMLLQSKADTKTVMEFIDSVWLMNKKE